MKKIIALLLCLLMVAAVFAGCSSGTSQPAASPAAPEASGEPAAPAAPAAPADGDVYEIVFNSTDLETTCNSQIVLAWEDVVTEASGGRLQFVNYWSGALASTPESIDAIKNGVIDLTFFITSVYPGVIVGANIMSAPGLGLTFDENGAMACWEVFTGYEPIAKEFDGMKLLGCSTNGGFTVFNSVRPIEKLADFSGLRIRINNSMTEGFLQHLGATPVSFNFGDTYENIEKNVCDGTMMDYDALYKMRIFEVAPYLLDTTGLCSTTTAVVMNPDCYDALPEDLQQIIDEYSGEYLVKLAGKMKAEANEKAIQDWKDAGGEFVPISDEILAAFPDAAQAGFDNFIAEADAAGFDGAEIVAIAKAAVEKWCA